MPFINVRLFNKRETCRNPGDNIISGFCGYYYYYSSTDCMLWVHDSCTRKEHYLKEQMLLWAVVGVPYIRTYHKNILFLPYIFVQTVHVWHQPFIYNFQNNLTSKTYNLNRKAVRSNLIQNSFGTLYSSWLWESLKMPKG